MRDEGYDIAQICLNGHLINSSSSDYPQFNKKYCNKCGLATITKCPDCNSEIPGHYNIPGRLSVVRYSIPSFCSRCGKPFPWTKQKLQAAHDLAQELDDISEEDRKSLNQSIDEIVKDTPSASVASMKFKRILSKTGKHVSQAFRDILVDILSEATKKVLWP
jgi:hypothetical protein